MIVTEISSKESLLMSSTEIAKYTSKQHRNVKRDIERMFSALSLDVLKVERIYLDSMNRKQTEYLLDRDQTYCLLTGYSASARMRVIKRWKELESGLETQMPDFNNPAEAARAWADEYEKNLKLKLKLEDADKEVSRLQGVCHTISAQFSPGTTPAEFCRQLNGVNVQKVQTHLSEKGMLIKSYRGYKSTSYYRDNWFAEKTIDCKDGKASSKVVLTKKGAVNIYKLYLKKDLPMKMNWDGEFTHCLFD